MIRRYLKLANIDADIATFPSVSGNRHVELRGDVAKLRGRPVMFLSNGKRYSLDFSGQDPQAARFDFELPDDFDTATSDPVSPADASQPASPEVPPMPPAEAQTAGPDRASRGSRERSRSPRDDDTARPAAPHFLRWGTCSECLSFHGSSPRTLRSSRVRRASRSTAWLNRQRQCAYLSAVAARVVVNVGRGSGSLMNSVSTTLTYSPHSASLSQATLTLKLQDDQAPLALLNKRKKSKHIPI